VRVTAPPEKGKANKAVIKILASTLGLPVRSVIIYSGAGSQQKMVELVDIDEQALKKILP
jgi:hypothetical protein